MSENGTILRIYLCGQLAIESAETVIPEGAFPARQGRRLWAYLALNRRQPIGRDMVAEAIWGDEAPDAWDVALNALVSRLRRTIRPAAAEIALVGEAGRYRLLLPATAFVDLERARDALHRAEVSMRRERVGEALAEARVAMEIAARGFLAGEEGAWVEGYRRLLHDIRMHALEHTVEGERRRGRLDAAEREAEHLIAIDPLRESSYRLLADVLAGNGNAGRAARVIEEGNRLLAAEAKVSTGEPQRG